MKRSNNPDNDKKKTEGSRDEQLLRGYQIPENKNLADYAMAPIRPGSLFIKNGVEYIIGGVSSGKSTLLSKLMAVYTKILNPIILSFYSGITQDETTTFALSSFGIKPYFIRIETPEAMVSFFDQFKYKRIKLAELLMFLMSVYKDNSEQLLESIQYTEELSIRDKTNESDKRVKALLFHVSMLIGSKKINVNPDRGFIYMSEFLTKGYSTKRRINFDAAPEMFIVRCLISFARGFHPKTITIDILNDPTSRPSKKVRPDVLLARFHPVTIKPFVRVSKGLKIELVPSISIFDDVASFPLLTAERAPQWSKDLLAETRRYMNTFVIAGQRYSLLNKTLRSLTHTFFIGYSLIDDDLPKIAKEYPSQLLSAEEFIKLYKTKSAPFSFIVYNCRYGMDFIKLHRD